jgi:hypothetical protein
LFMVGGILMDEKVSHYKNVLLFVAEKILF